MNSSSRHARALAILVTALLIMSCGCENDATNPGSDDAKTLGSQPGVISGTVRDAAGNPVAGASIILTYEVPFGRPLTADKNSTRIVFELQEPTFAKFWIGDGCRDDLVRLLFEGELDAGEHAITWDGQDDDGRHVLDGSYQAHAHLEGQFEDLDIFLARNTIDDLAMPDDYRRLATTGGDGQFAFDDTCLDFGHVFDSADENGEPQDVFVISRNVRIWALHLDHPTGSTPEHLYVDPLEGLVVEIVMPE